MKVKKSLLKKNNRNIIENVRDNLQRKCLVFGSEKRWIRVARWRLLSRRFGGGGGGVVVKVVAVVGLKGFWGCELEIEREREKERERDGCLS